MSTLYNQTESCVLNCGQSSGWFDFNRGVRQGCLISPSLFVLAAEKLAEAVRGEESGLELNLHKTQGVILGEMELTRNISKEIKWENRIKILGIHFDSGSYANKDQVLNFDPAIAKMKRTCNSWRMRTLSLKGKIVILNTLVLPIIY